MASIYLTQEPSTEYMVVDCGDPRSLIGRANLNTYLDQQGLQDEKLETKPSIIEKFNFGKTSFTSKEIVNLPIKIEDTKGDKNILMIDVHVLEGPFLFYLGRTQENCGLPS